MGAFHRIVVDEDEGIEAKVELGSQRTKILRLGQPIHAPGDDMLRAQHHVGARREDSCDVLFHVLAGECHQHAFLLQFDGAPLQGEHAWGQFDALRPVLANHATP